MSSGSMVLLDAAGRRRSLVTIPGHLAGRAPRNKGMQYPPDPPRAEEIIMVMRQAGRDRHGLRLPALIAVLWRGGLRISEALALTETDIDPGRGVLARPPRQGRQAPRGGDGPVRFRAARRLAVSPCFAAGRAVVLRHRRPYPRSRLGRYGRQRGAALARRPGRSSPPVRSAPAAPRARSRARPRGRCCKHHSTPTRAHRSGNDVDLTCGARTPARSSTPSDRDDRPPSPRPPDSPSDKPAASSERPLPLRPIPAS